MKQVRIEKQLIFHKLLLILLLKQSQPLPCNNGFLQDEQKLNSKNLLFELLYLLRGLIGKKIEKQKIIKIEWRYCLIRFSRIQRKPKLQKKTKIREIENQKSGKLLFAFYNSLRLFQRKKQKKIEFTHRIQMTTRKRGVRKEFTKKNKKQKKIIILKEQIFQIMDIDISYFFYQ
ncbi:unnamed protein product [Paramecium primaurelia]|uniref:Transmembrane protein n=1 Tax=Paramecium primaurelia TaxID=5886 RepID=A0A8S1N386_PARPR|nr:unnamed protein product [Paramecium primaurelia]